MTHDLAFERLPDLLLERDDPDLLAHVGSCHRCQRQLFLLSRVDRLLRQRRPHARARRRPLALAIAGVAAAAITIAVVLPQRHAASPARFALRTSGGAIVARAQIQRGDAENESMAFVAKGLPARPTDTYLLWTEGPDNGEPVIVGRFMVSHSGECRARFNLPGTRRPSRFWITPSKEPAAVVAST
jgi:anti-sigma-K factor RskA